MNNPIGYGLVGCGAFGRFCLEQYATLPSLRRVAVADADRSLAENTAAAFGLEACASPEELIARPDIDIVHIATPPFTHHAFATAALRAGKHVLCEKPLAVSAEEAEEMAALSRERGLVLAVNLIMRYNPLCAAVKAIVEQRLLGEPIHACFLNDAKDEQLGPSHWFWDPRKSGGIFVEHGVHFFDLFDWWFGPGRVVSAQHVRRPGTEIVDQVAASAVHGAGVLTYFYHGFHQAARRDRQEWRIVFECGTLTMSEWVPTSLDLDFLAEEAVAGELRDLLPGCELEVAERFTGGARRFTSRHRPREADARFLLHATAGMEKMELYGFILRALMRDQIEAMRNPAHRRAVTEENGVASLLTAIRARDLAESSPPAA